MHKILIVDDEKYIRDELKYLLGKIDACDVIAETGDADDVYELIEGHQIDIVFLDIELRHENGLQVARRINDMKNPPCIILSTAHDEYAMSGYELNVIDYILKPFSEDRVRRAIDKAIEKLGRKQKKEPTKNKLAVEHHGKMIILPIEEAIYFEAFGNNAFVKTKDETYTLSSSLKQIEEKLTDHHFIRISKTHIVNIDYVIEMIPWFNYKCKLTLNQCSEELFVTRNYYKRFKEQILIK